MMAKAENFQKTVIRDLEITMNSSQQHLRQESPQCNCFDVEVQTSGENLNHYVIRSFFETQQVFTPKKSKITDRRDCRVEPVALMASLMDGDSMGALWGRNPIYTSSPNPRHSVHIWCWFCTFLRKKAHCGEKRQNF